MDVAAELYRPARLAAVAWELLWPAFGLGLLSVGCSLLGRLLTGAQITAVLPTFSRAIPALGQALAATPVLGWGVWAMAVLLMWCDVVFTGHGDTDLFPAYFLMVPISGVGAVLVERGCEAASAAQVRPMIARDAIVIATVAACWTFVVVVLVFRWV